MLLKTYSKQYGLNALNEFTLSCFNSACSSGYRYDYERWNIQRRVWFIFSRSWRTPSRSISIFYGATVAHIASNWQPAERSVMHNVLAYGPKKYKMRDI